VFNNDEFKRGLKLFLSPDKAARMIITHDTDPATPKASRTSTRSGTRRRSRQGNAAGRFYIHRGTAATYSDIQDGAKYDR
jgi:RND superfamily putative drug exporter